ncbi:MAG: HNH endonuclease [Anaerolineae bacterium]
MIQQNLEEKAIFKDIPGYEGLYTVSNMGDVKSLNYSRSGKEGLLKLIAVNDIYLHVNLVKDKERRSFSVHQLVAMAFLCYIPNGREKVVDHINNNPKDNRLENLQVISSRENLSKDKYRYGKTSNFTGVHLDKKCGRYKAIISYKDRNQHLGRFDCEVEASKVYQKALSEIENGTFVPREVKIPKGYSYEKRSKLWRVHKKGFPRKFFKTEQDCIDFISGFSMSMDLSL